jgi:pimeloyl-ACP methyl ester carboxylesterase
MLWVDERGSGLAVVLLHNGVMDARAWDGQMEPFARSHRVVRYDSPGFGRSGALEEDYRETEVLLSLLDERTLGRVALVGNSRGGRIAIDFALAHPERVSALVLVCAAVSGYRLSAYSPVQSAAEDAALERRDAETVADLTLEVWGRLGADARIRQLIVANALADLATAHERPPRRMAIDHLEEIRASTLVITGDHDAPPLAELGDLLERRISGAERMRFADSDHFPNLREPERFDRVVLDFLQRASA